MGHFSFHRIKRMANLMEAWKCPTGKLFPRIASFHMAEMPSSKMSYFSMCGSSRRPRPSACVWIVRISESTSKCSISISRTKVSCRSSTAGCSKRRKADQVLIGKLWTFARPFRCRKMATLHSCRHDCQLSSLGSSPSLSTWSKERRRHITNPSAIIHIFPITWAPAK